MWKEERIPEECNETIILVVPIHKKVTEKSARITGEQH
jgi:hypothetical protein